MCWDSRAAVSVSSRASRSVVSRNSWVSRSAAHEALCLALGALTQLLGLALGGFAGFLGLPRGLRANLIGLPYALLQPVVGTGTGAGGDLLGGLVRALEDPAGLIGDLLERVPDRRFRRRGDLQLRDHPVHLLDVAIDGVAVISPQGDREVDVPEGPREASAL